MKKTSRLLLILLICVMSLTGCGGVTDTSSKSASQKEEINQKLNEELDQELKTDNAEKSTSASGVSTEVDKYQTSKVPKGKPVPVEPEKTDINKKTEYHCTLSITCNSIFDNMDKFDEAKLEVLPSDGIIYEAKEVVFYEGESVFDVLLREIRDNKIHMEFVETPIYNSNYIEGINNIYEFDAGELSGWMYKVNDWFPNYGCSRYKLEDKDVIEWVYTCDLGSDVGGDWAAQNSNQEQ